MKFLSPFARVGASVGIAAFAASVALAAPPESPVPWSRALRQPAAFYASAEASRIADNLLLYQHDNGGWVKNTDMSAPLDPAHRAELEEEKTLDGTTLDNASSWTQTEFLCRVYSAAHTARFADAANKGIDYLLAAQYPNGGWPQYYPLRKGYYTHITFNDDAMIGAMTVLRDVADGKPPYAFVDAARRDRARAAVDRGIACILRCQIRENGKPTAWCQQHDETTLAPAPARKFELVGLTGSESVGVVRFLMSLPNPSPAVREAIEGAVAWFERTRITGLRVVRKPAPGTPKGVDVVVESDPAAPPLWARFYEIGTDRPFFSGRDSIKKYSLAEIELERRVGYAWYTPKPAALLATDYPAWRARVRQTKTAKVNP